MRPELFRVFEVGFPAYFVLLLSGFLFATAMGALWARRIGKDPDVIVDLGLACLLMGVVGGRLLHVIADVAIVAGVGLMAIDMFTSRKPKAPAPAASAEEAHRAP